jgi:tetratricopeptide (TPR) repeat protein
MFSLGIAYCKQGRYQEALQLQAKALEGYRACYGNERFETLWGLKTLAKRKAEGETFGRFGVLNVMKSADSGQRSGSTTSA